MDRAKHAAWALVHATVTAVCAWVALDIISNQGAGLGLLAAWILGPLAAANTIACVVRSVCVFLPGEWPC